MLDIDAQINGAPGQRRVGVADVAEIAGNAAVEMSPVLGDRELEIDNEHALPVEGNPDELHRMVLNLLDNAVKWSPPSGTVRIRLHDGTLTVDDEGPGIPESDREQVFDRFYRSDAARAMPGSGLGLAIVREVAEAHGGSVSAEEAPGGGALLRLRLAN